MFSISLFIILLIATSTAFWSVGNNFILAVTKAFILMVIIAIIVLFAIVPKLVELGLITVIV